MSETLDEKNALWLRIVTPERIRLEASAHWVQIPTPDGMLGVWPQHAPLISALTPGEIEYEGHDGTHREWISGGIVHIRQGGHVLVLTGSRDQVYTLRQAGLGAWDESIRDLAQVFPDDELGIRDLEDEAA